MSSDEQLQVPEQPRRHATINDVAALAKVSIKTVSRVFNSEPNVRPQTKERVLQAARELHYRPNLSARRLATNRSFVIGLLYDNPESDYVTAIQEGSLGVCRERGYHLLIHPFRTEDPDFLEDVMGLYRQSTVDGFILTQPISENDELIRSLDEAGARYVRISQRTIGNTPCVSVDDTQAAFEMTNYLIKLGHRHIGFIMGHPEHGSSHDRLAGYRQALAKQGLAFDESLTEQGLYNFESGYSCARRLLSLDQRPTAIFASNDHMAMGVLRVAHEQKIEIPNELSVCGFDDTPMARYAWPPLTTLRQPIKLVARLATEALLAAVERKTDEERPLIELHSELIKRASTGPVPS